MTSAASDGVEGFGGAILILSRTGGVFWVFFVFFVIPAVHVNKAFRVCFLMKNEWFCRGFLGCF